MVTKIIVELYTFGILVCFQYSTGEAPLQNRAVTRAFSELICEGNENDYITVGGFISAGMDTASLSFNINNVKTPPLQAIATAPHSRRETDSLVFVY